MLQDFYQTSLQFIKQTTRFIAETSKDIAGPVVTKISTETVEKLKEIYHGNKEIVISVSVAAVVYLVMRKRQPKTTETSLVSKKKQAKRSQIKSFISEHSQIEEEDPTTETRNEWSIERRRVRSEEFLSSKQEQQEQQGEDKIFFQLYRGYQASSL